MSDNTVRNWRASFLKDRIGGLLGKRRAGRGYRLTDGMGGPTLDLVEGGRVRGRPTVVLDEDEQLSLRSLALGLQGTGARSDRCRMILLSADGLTDETVAAKLGVGGKTVGKWRRRFLEEGVWGLLGKPWLGLGPPLTDKQAAEIIARSLNTASDGPTRWTARAMSDATGLSKTTIRRTWSALGAYPRPWKMLELSSDPLFVEKVRGIAGLYLQPPLRAMVLCIGNRGRAGASVPRDEADQGREPDRAQEVAPIMLAESRPRDRRVLGTNSLLFALDAAAGFDRSEELARFRAEEVHEFLREIDRSVPDDLTLHIILDYSVKYESATIRHWLARRPRWHVHVAPTPAAWVYQAERWFAELKRKQSELGEKASVHRLTADIRAFVDRHFDGPEPYIWPASTDVRLAAVARPVPLIERTRAESIAGNGLGQRNGLSPELERSQDRNSVRASSAGQASSRQEANLEEGSGDAAGPDAGSREDCNCSRLDCALELFQRETLSELIIMLASIDRDVFNRVIQALMDARHVLVISRDRDRICAIHMQRIAARRFHNWQHVRCSSPETVEVPVILAPGDVVVGLALGPFDHSSPFDDHTLRLVERAQAIGARVIGLVDRLESTLSAHANDVLHVPGLRPLTFPTYLPTMVLVEALVEILGARVGCFCSGAPGE